MEVNVGESIIHGHALVSGRAMGVLAGEFVVCF